VTLEVWIGLWQKYFSHDPKMAFASLIYIGYCSKMAEAITVYKCSPADYLKTSKRKVFNAYIISHHSCEKLLDAFIKNNHQQPRGEEDERSVVNYIGADGNPNGKYLIVIIFVSLSLAD
jgi:hypothetical protein